MDAVVAGIQILPSGGGSRVRPEFSPVPATSVPGYDRWLESAGLVMHNVPLDVLVPRQGTGHRE